MDQYEGPSRAELQDYADMMNGYPKHVISTTFEEPLEWNNATLIKGNVALCEARCQATILLGKTRGQRA